MQRSHPKGRSVRGRTVGKIVHAFENSSSERLSISEIRNITGTTTRALSGTLKEMIELGGIIRIVNNNWPPSTYYMFVEALTDENISETEDRYEGFYHDRLPLMNPIKRTEHHALREGLRFARERLTTMIGRRMSITDSTIKALQKSYFKLLNQAIDDLHNVADDSFRDETPDKWEKCANCIYGKKTPRTDGYVCICTREWNTGNRPEYEPYHLCTYFRMRIPKN